jgi:hypothetical protein
MPRTTIKVHEREKMQPVIQKATPLGALPTEAIVNIGAVNIVGSAAAMRALSEACDEAAVMAESYDDDPATYDQRERGEAIETP